MQNVTDLLREADFWAGEAGHEVVTAADVERALDMQIYHASRLRERLQEAILRETILIDTEGAIIGQVNGLSVLMLDNFAFGHPSRITAGVAAALHAELVGLFVEDVNLLRLAQLPFAQEISYLAAAPRKMDVARMTRQLKAQATQARQQLRQMAEEREVRWSFRVVRGLVADELLGATPETDLLVLGRVSRPRALKPVLGSTARTVVARTTRSILLIPSGADLERPVLVLYDGSAGGRRALALAGKLAQATGRLRVLMEGPRIKNLWFSPSVGSFHSSWCAWRMLSPQ